MAPKPTRKGKKQLPGAPLSSKVVKKVVKHPLFEKTPRTFRIGGDILPRKDLTRFVKWPKYIRLQRQKKILLQRLKVPPAINQFNHAIDKNQRSQLFRLLGKYKPETRQTKQQRLRNEAGKAALKGPSHSKKPVMLKFGLNHITDLIEVKRAKLVVIAHDVDPIDLVVWVPALCRKKDIPYCIVKGKAKLGAFVHKKTCAVVAFDSIRMEDQAEFELLCRNFRSQFNDNFEIRRHWGGGLLNIKSQHIQEKKEKMLALEQAKKLGLGYK